MVFLDFPLLSLFLSLSFPFSLCFSWSEVLFGLWSLSSDKLFLVRVSSSTHTFYCYRLLFFFPFGFKGFSERLCIAFKISKVAGISLDTIIFKTFLLWGLLKIGFFKLWKLYLIRFVLNLLLGNMLYLIHFFIVLLME